MSLPQYKHPIYTLKLPSSGKEVKYRPFLVKDEKNLLLAQQSEDEVTMLDTLKAVISNCILGDTKVDELPIFDIEYIFTQLRAKSVGENVDLLFTCRDKACGEKTKIGFKIEPKLVKEDDHSNKIDLFEDVGVVMKYATVDMLKEIQKLDLNDADAILRMIAHHVDYIYDAESVYPAKEQKEEDLIKFLEDLPTAPTKKLKKFFESTPKLQQVVEYDCPKCGAHNTYTVEGIESFF
jgi:hypothetical protein